MDALIKVLEMSVEKNGAGVTVTLGHLLNIAKMAQLVEQTEEAEREGFDDRCRQEAFNESHRHGS